MTDIVFSTAKFILKIFKHEGRIGKLTKRIKKMKSKEEGIFHEKIIILKESLPKQCNTFDF